MDSRRYEKYAYTCKKCYKTFAMNYRSKNNKCPYCLSKIKFTVATAELIKYNELPLIRKIQIFSHCLSTTREIKYFKELNKEPAWIRYYFILYDLRKELFLEYKTTKIKKRLNKALTVSLFIQEIKERKLNSMTNKNDIFDIDRISDIVEKRNMTLRDVCRKAGVNSDYLYQLKARPHRTPDANKLFLLANALDCSIYDFFTDEAKLKFKNQFFL